MASLPEPVLALVGALGQLPGIGPRSAERLALHLVQSETGQVKQLAEALVTATERIELCNTCGALTETQPCALCTDDRRDSTTLCVVETAVDVINVDKSGTFQGHFHVLGGKISPLNGVDPEDLRIVELEARTDGVKEVILALGTDVETLEDLVFTAVNSAITEGQRIQAEEMGKVTAGFNLPGMG